MFQTQIYLKKTNPTSEVPPKSFVSNFWGALHKLGLHIFNEKM